MNTSITSISIKAMRNGPATSSTKKRTILIWALIGAAGFFALILVIVVAGGKLLMHEAGLSGDSVRVEDASRGTFQVKPAKTSSTTDPKNK